MPERSSAPRRFRFRLRTLMVAVLLAALFLGVPLYWASWLRKASPFQVNGGVHANVRAPGRLVAGETTPVELGYEYELSSPKPPAGLFFRVRTEIALEDRASGTRTEQFTFDRFLISGLRRESTGTITWKVRPPHAGQYYVRYKMSYMDPFGRWSDLGNGASGYTVRAPVSQQSPAPP